MSDTKAPDRKRTQTVTVRYETSDVAFVSQFLINRTQEELVLNCSPGYLADPQSGGTILPINCRIALTLPGARRLAETLQQALGQEQPAADEAATLPRLD